MSRFEVVSGVGGHSLYLDDTRISGPKPLGGGQLVEAFNTEEKYVPERTCHVNYIDGPDLIPDFGFYICGRCGTGFAVWKYGADGDEHEVTPVCCPNCKAEIIEVKL